MSMPPDTNDDEISHGRTTPGGRGRDVATRTGRAFRRQWPLLAAGVVVVATAGASGAVAGSLVTSAQIQDRTIQARDMANGSVTARVIRDGSVSPADLTAAARAALAGQPGAPGSKWLTGAGAPTNQSAVDGDWYLDSTAKSVYTRVGGTWGHVVDLEGPKGDDGEAGRAGSQWLSGEGAPGSGTGDDGDWYLDTTTSRAFQKQEGRWVFRVDLRGVAGPAGLDGDKGDAGDDGLDGATWYSGEGVPDADAGKDGDLYLDRATSDVYQRDAGTWAVLTNIKGQKGDPGEDGEDGGAGTAGVGWTAGDGAPAKDAPEGSLYLDTDSGDVYRHTGGSWGTPVANLTGPAAPGGGGTSWLSGTGAPAAGTGSDGSWYLDRSTGAVHQKSGGAWTPLYTPAAEKFPNVELNLGASGQTFFTKGPFQPMQFSVPLSESASLSGSNTWDGSSFRVGSGGSGWYQVDAQALSLDVSGVQFFLDRNGAIGNNPPSSETRQPYAMSTFPRGRDLDQRESLAIASSLHTTIYLHAGEWITLRGQTSHAVGSAFLNFGSNLTITRIE